MEMLARAERRQRDTGHSLHDCLQSLCQMGRRRVTLAGVHRERTVSGGRETPRHQCVAWRRDQHRGQKRGDGIGYSGYKHQKGEKLIAIIDNNGYVLAPLPVAPVNETDMVLLPKGLHALKQVAKQVGLDLRDAYLNLDGDFDSTRNRKCIFNAGMIPNIPMVRQVIDALA
jgi:hypothetical protein